MLHHLLSSGSTSERNSVETTIVVEEGEQRREFILLARMAPLPPSDQCHSPHFPCSSVDFVAFDPPSAEHPPLCAFSSSPPFPTLALQNSPLTTDDVTNEHSHSLDEKENPWEKESKDKLALMREGDENGTVDEETSVGSADNGRSSSPHCPSPRSANRFFSLPKGEVGRQVGQCQRLKKMDEQTHRFEDIHLNANNSNGISPSPASVDPSDPYQCRWCQFNTLYKGNMKRHLITCHQVSVHLLNRVQFDVERLRKFSGQRPTWDELPIRPRRDGRDDGWTGEAEEDGGRPTSAARDRQLGSVANNS